MRITCPGVMISYVFYLYTTGNDGDQHQVFWMQDGVMFIIGHRRGVRTPEDDVDTHDVIIDSAAETDQGLYQCQAVPSGFRATTYLWVDGTIQSAIVSDDKRGRIFGHRTSLRVVAPNIST